MFDWQAELADLVSIPLVHSRVSAPQNVMFSALSVPVPAQTVAPAPKSFVAALGSTRSSSSEEAPYPVACIRGMRFPSRLDRRIF